jgi:hypothetical protein
VISKADTQDKITINGKSYYYIESEAVKTSKTSDVRQWCCGVMKLNSD